MRKVREQLAPTGVLRAGINMSNFLLVNGNDSNGSGSTNDTLRGVSPDMAQAIAKELGVGVELITYSGPGLVADAALNNEWDIANIAAESERAKTIHFSPAYCEIQATYLVPANSSLRSVSDVDQAGNVIAVKERAAYDLWLTENLKHASLKKYPSMDASFDQFVEQSLDALAGLRPRLLEDKARLAGSVVFDDSFTAVQQSVGCRQGKPEAAAFLHEFVMQSVRSGFIASLISKHGVEGKLSVAQHA